jgi:hypothetical protein
VQRTLYDEQQRASAATSTTRPMAQIFTA